MASLRTASFEEIRQAAGRICRDYLNGEWKEVSPDKLIVKRISGGLSNLLYYVSLPQDNPTSEANDSVEGLQRKATTSSSSPSSTLSPSSSTTLSPPQDNDVNRNEPVFSDLLTAGDCNGNKRKRYDSTSSTLTTALRHKEPKQVLLRIYGQSHGEDALEQMITESVVFALLSERHFGPRLYGIFPGGRIEQYIPARALHTSELALPEISLRIAEKMAEIHSLNIPMSKEPDWIWNCMERWQRHIPEILSRTDWQDHELISAQHMRAIDFEKEALWMKQVIKKANCPVAFCHNDLQEGNILLKSSNDALDCNAEDSSLENISMNSDDVENGTSNKLATDLDTSADSAIGHTIISNVPDLKIIDFEYCAYNYRGFDLANHFLEWTFNYSRPDFPFYYYHSENFPTKEQRHCFIKRYLKKLNDSEEDWEPSQKEIDEVDVEVKIFRMMSHLFWTLWSLMNVTSNIEFAYWDYAVTRINEYLVLKQNFITDNMMTV